jgi:hypothetical protein
MEMNNSLSNLICFICREAKKYYKKCKNCNNFFCEDCVNKWKNVCIDDFGKPIFCFFCKGYLSITDAYSINNKIKNLGYEESKNNVLNNINNVQNKINEEQSINYNNNNYPNENSNRKIIKFDNKNFKCIIDTGKLEKYNSNFKEINNNPNKMKFNEIINNSINYSEEYDLFYCGKNNNINCSCCKDKICKLGNCLCVNCMKINIEYHDLKSHYLINKSGRLAKVNKILECFCKCMFIEDNSPVLCGYRNKVSKKIYRCKSCEDLTKIITNYLSLSQINNLIKTEKEELNLFSHNNRFLNK